MSTETTTERYQGEVESEHTTSFGNQVINYALNEELFKQKLAENPGAESGYKIEFRVSFVLKDSADVPAELLEAVSLLLKESVTPGLYVAGALFGDDLRTDISPAFEIGHYAMIFATQPIERDTN